MKRKIDAMHDEYGLYPDKCANCCNFISGKYHGRQYYKCVAYGLSHSEATDWRLKYYACGLFGREFDELRPRRRPLVEMIGRDAKEQDGPLEGQVGLWG